MKRLTMKEFRVVHKSRLSNWYNVTTTIHAVSKQQAETKFKRDNPNILITSIEQM